MNEVALLSIVVPAFDEQEVIREFHSRLVRVLAQISDLDHEILYIDDGSRDGTFEILCATANQDPKVRVYRLSRNFGHQVAITCGLDYSRGDAVVLIDADLQDPPEVILEMVALWRKGVDVAYGVRRSRAGERRIKLWTARVFYRLLRSASDIDIPMDTGDFRLMSRRAVNAVAQLREESRFVRGLVAWVGFVQQPVFYDRDARGAGSTHYGIRDMLHLAKNGMAGFSDKPLRIATNLGITVSTVAFLAGVYIVMSKLLNPAQSTPGFAALATLVLFLGGVQLVAIGMLGEYLGRVFHETKRRPLYFVMEEVGGTDSRA